MTTTSYWQKKPLWPHNEFRRENIDGPKTYVEENEVEAVLRKTGFVSPINIAILRRA